MANYNVTLPVGQTTPVTDIGRIWGYNRKATIKYTDVAVASATTSTDTVTVLLGNTPAKWGINKALVNITTAFAGTSALTMTVGTPGTANAMITSTSVLTAGMLGQASGVAVMTNLTSTAATTIQAVFTNATGDSPSALTAGQLDIYYNVMDGSTTNISGGLS